MQRVLVTGSSRGIGKAIALRAGADGFDVVVHCVRDRGAAERLGHGLDREPRRLHRHRSQAAARTRDAVTELHVTHDE